MTIKQALISVSDKKGVVEFAKELNKLGIKIISSGGTAKALSESKVDCREISDVTGFPETLDGRVKTLNPKIHGGILARRDKKSHLEELKKHKIEPIDIVAVNLYPFEETINRNASKTNAITEDIIENIDIGGVALLRAAAKNFKDVLVVCDPADYPVIIEKIKAKSITPEFRRDLAAKAFRHTAYYDSLISGYLTAENFPYEFSIPIKRIASLRYGENPHQKASVYRYGLDTTGTGIVSAKILQGKELSYNNYLDLDSAWKLVWEFEDAACAIIKHNNPCGCAEAGSILEAHKKALACDPVSAFGGIIAFNREVDGDTAGEVVKVFTECVIAPSFSEKAKQVFAGKKNLRLLEQPSRPAKPAGTLNYEFRQISGGMLTQDKDELLLNETKTVTKRAPKKAELESLKFAMKVCKNVKSNAIILVRGSQTVGVGAGQMSRIDSLKIAIEKMKAVDKASYDDSIPLVLASDAFFPFNDVVNESAKLGVQSIIQPGGSIRDEDSIKAADEHKMAMVFTGVRHFKH
ncbi:MAG: bifunctional phosphoribosylaminoimidazolecarboxamide formyltransferase/IMP cyclohydrolase [Elusimicrobiota bacterium]